MLSTSSEWLLIWSGEEIETLLMLYQAIVHSKLDYGCIVYGAASITDLRQLDSIHNSGLRLALGAFCTSPVSSLYTEANEAPLEKRWLKLPMHYFFVPALTIQHIMPCMNSTGPLEIYMLPGQMGEEAWPDPRPLQFVSKWRKPWPLQRSMPNWSAPWGHPTFHQERTITMPGDTISLKQ